MVRAVLALLLSVAATAHAAELTVTDAFSRATPGTGPAAAYFTIHGGDAPDRLLGVRSTLVPQVEIHTMTMHGDVMRMREVAAIDVPSRATVKLAPGAGHLMLMGLQAPLKPGDSVPLTLRFEHAGERTLVVPVGAPGATGPMPPRPLSRPPGEAPVMPER